VTKAIKDGFFMVGLLHIQVNRMNDGERLILYF
jgi:hypothetical protein